MATTLTSFTPGDIVISVYGNGDGSNPNYTLDQAGAITLYELTTTGSIVGQLVLPETTTVVNGVTEYAISGEYGSASEGTLELSGNGQSLSILGYGVNDVAFDTAGTQAADPYGSAALGQSTSIKGGVYTAVPRVVANISYNGKVDTSTAIYGIYNTNNPRSVATVNGTTFYLSGQGVKGSTNQGVFVATDGTTSATAIDTSTDTRVAEIVNGVLYVSRDSTLNATSGTDIGSYGGLPTSATSQTPLIAIDQTVTLTAGQTNTVNSGMVGSSVNLSPEAFYFANATTLYVADSGSPKNGGVGDGGLQKWSLVNGTWVLDYTLSTGLNLVTNTTSAGATNTGTTGLYGLTGVTNGGTVTLYATTSTAGELDQSYLYSITDTLSTTTLPTTESFTQLMSASADTIIRGVAFAPSAPTVAAPVLTTTLATFQSATSGSTVTTTGTTGEFDTTQFTPPTTKVIPLFDGSSVSASTTLQVQQPTNGNGGYPFKLSNGYAGDLFSPEDANGNPLTSVTISLSGQSALGFYIAPNSNSTTLASSTITVTLSDGTTTSFSLAGGNLNTGTATPVFVGFSGGNETSVTITTTDPAGFAFGDFQDVKAASTVTVVSSGSTNPGLVISNGSSVSVLSGGTLGSATVLSGGSATISGGIDAGGFIANGATETLRTGSASGGQVNGVQNVNGSLATISNELVANGGVVNLLAPVVSGTVTSAAAFPAGALKSLPVSTTSVGSTSATPVSFTLGGETVTFTANNGDLLELDQAGNNYNDNNYTSGTYLVAQGGYSLTSASTDSTTVSFSAPVSAFSIGADDFDTTQTYVFNYTVTTTEGTSTTYTATSLADNGQSPAILAASSTKADIASVTISDAAASSPDGDFVLGNIGFATPLVTSGATSSTLTSVPVTTATPGTTSSTPVTFTSPGQAVTFTANNGDLLEIDQAGNNYNDNNYTSGTYLVAQGGYNLASAATDSTTVSFAAPVAGFSISADDFDTTQAYTFTYVVKTSDAGSYTYTASSLADNGQSPAILAATSNEADIVSVTISDTAASSPDGDFVLGNVGYIPAPVDSAITVTTGGTVNVSGTELVSNAVINGGTLVLSASNAAVTGSLTFSGGGTLRETGSALPSAGFGDQAVISGFGSGAVIDVTPLAFSGATISTAVVSGNTVATVTNGGASATFTFAGSVGSTLGLAADTLASPGAEIVFVPPPTSNVVVSSGVGSSASIASGSTLTVSGGATEVSATISSGGSALIGGTDSGTTILAGGSETVSGAAIGDKIYGVQLVSASTATTSNETVFNGGALDLFLKGGVSTGTVVSSGGLFAISGFAVGSNTTLAGNATVALQSPKASLTGAVILQGTNDTILVTGLTSAGFGLSSTSAGANVAPALISGFVAGDAVDVNAFGVGATLSTVVSSGNTVVTISSGSTATQNTQSFVFAGAYTSGFFKLTPDDAINGNQGVEIVANGTPCYCPGTLIATPDGEVPVESLAIGDRVTTATGQQRPIKWIGRRAYGGRFAAGKKHILPVRFTQGSLGDGLPRRDLVVSPLHAMFLDEVLIPASALVNGVSIVQLDRVESVEYIHIELETHDVILAEGAPSETFIDDQSRGMFHNAAEYARLYPDAAMEPARYCAPRLEYGDEVEAVRRRLASLAAPAASFGAGIEGCLDEASRGRVRGWARDRAAPGQPVHLQIVADGLVLCEVVADMFRADLLAAGLGDGRHAFDVSIPGGLSPDQAHVISVRRKDDGAALGQRLCA